MKKVFYLLFIILLVGGCNSSVSKPDYVKKVNDAKTLDEYLMALKDENIYTNAEELGINYEELYYYFETIKCDVLKNNNIMYMDYNGFILENGDYYDYVTEDDKIYSNGEQCMKREGLAKILKTGNYNFYTEDKKICVTEYGSNRLEFKCSDESYRINLFLYKKDDILKVIDSKYGDYKNNIQYYNYYVIKSDGKIYNILVGENYNNSTFKIYKEEVYLDNEKYGKIIDVDAYYDYDKNDLIIRKLVTDNGLYMLENIETEECVKYEDVICEKELAKNEVLEKFKDSIKYFGKNEIVTNNNLIISSDSFIGRKVIEFK